MLEAICSIQDYTKTINQTSFLEHRLIQVATIRNFEIIGEASKKMSQNLNEQYSAIIGKKWQG